MDIFLSWSGKKSGAVAEYFHKWIKRVIQPIRPWISKEDLAKGTFFMNDITKSLSDNKFCILFLTEENKNEPWILFEAGAVYKGLEGNRVFTFLIDLTYNDLKPPLSNLNHTIYNKDDIQKLLHDINALLPEKEVLEKEVLDDAFETNWGKFDETFKEIVKNNIDKKKEPKRSTEDMLQEVLYTIRALDQKISINNNSNTSSILKKNLEPESDEILEYLKKNYSINKSHLDVAESNRIKVLLDKGYSKNLIVSILGTSGIGSESISKEIDLLQDKKTGKHY